MELKPGYKLTEAGVIPDDWGVSLLDSVAKRGSGHTPDKKHPEYWDGEIKWVSLKDSDALDNLFIETTAATITQAGIANSSAVVHPAGTVVLSRDAGVGKSAITKTEMAVSQHFMAWQCGPRLENHFLYYWLQAEKSEFERIAFGNTIKTIGLPYFRALKIPLPSLPEQRAIVAALNDADALIVQVEKLIAKKRDLKQAAMQRLLTGERRLPGFRGDWEAKQFGGLFQFMTTANNPRADLVPFGDVGYIHYGDIHTTTSAFLNCAQTSLPSIAKELVAGIPFVEEGDLVVADASEDYSGIGKSVEVQNLGGRRVVAGLHTFLLRGSKELLADGFKGYLQFIPSVKAALVRFATGISVYGVSKNNLRRVEARLPKPDEQMAIATVLSDMDTEVAALEHRRYKTRALKQGMMQELLTGRTRLV